MERVGSVSALDLPSHRKDLVASVRGSNVHSLRTVLKTVTHTIEHILATYHGLAWQSFIVASTKHEDGYTNALAQRHATPPHDLHGRIESKSHFDSTCILLSSTEIYMQAIAGKNKLKIGSQTFKLREIAPEITFSDYHGCFINYDEFTTKVALNTNRTQSIRKLYVQPIPLLFLLGSGKTEKLQSKNFLIRLEVLRISEYSMILEMNARYNLIFPIQILSNFMVSKYFQNIH